MFQRVTLIVILTLYLFQVGNRSAGQAAPCMAVQTHALGLPSNDGFNNVAYPVFSTTPGTQFCCSINNDPKQHPAVKPGITAKSNHPQIFEHINQPFSTLRQQGFAYSTPCNLHISEATIKTTRNSNPRIDLSGRWPATGKYLHGYHFLLSVSLPVVFWQTLLFKILVIVLVIIAIAELFVWRLNELRRRDQQEQQVRLQMMELQDRALRAQMNPHFIFNCLNSIKSLIQHGDAEGAVEYLTVFTKLIRSLLQNADKRYVTLHEEVAVCQHYLALESLRFGDRFRHEVDIDPEVDIKSIEVPTLILQPLLENAIWHGLIPKEGSGLLTLTISQENDTIICIVDDNGIGRQASKRMNSGRGAHQSKGVSLTNDRIDLYNMLRGIDATMTIKDKKDLDGNPTGTMVTLRFGIN